MNLIILPVIDSTNSYAQQLIQQEKASDGTIILALEQSEGRGQRGKQWESEKGMGLFASIILTPEKIPAVSQFLLNKAIANGVASFLESKVGRKMQIKWPNDILAENEKVAGILIESNIRGPFFSSLVVGIGINLNQQLFHGAYETPPVSLKILTGTSFEPETVATELYGFVRKKYNQFIDRDYDGVEEEYRSRIYKRGELAVFSKNGKYFSATLTDVDDNGAAVLQVGDTVIRESHPEVRFAPGANR